MAKSDMSKGQMCKSTLEIVLLIYLCISRKQEHFVLYQKIKWNGIKVIGKVSHLLLSYIAVCRTDYHTAFKCQILWKLQIKLKINQIYILFATTDISFYTVINVIYSLLN